VIRGGAEALWSVMKDYSLAFALTTIAREEIGSILVQVPDTDTDTEFEIWIM